MTTISAEVIEAAAEASHDAYEHAALRHGWETQERSRKPWADVPEENKATVREATRAALEVAMPVIENELRNVIAQEINDRAKYIQNGAAVNYTRALREAARIVVRGGTA